MSNELRIDHKATSKLFRAWNLPESIRKRLALYELCECSGKELKENLFWQEWLERNAYFLYKGELYLAVFANDSKEYLDAGADATTFIISVRKSTAHYKVAIIQRKYN